MFVVFSKDSKESGVYHKNLRALYEANESVRNCMSKLADLPLLLLDNNFSDEQLFDSIDQNFNFRREMLGNSVGDFNLKMVNLARQNNLCAKQAGSGGAIFCMPRNNSNSISFEQLKAKFESEGFEISRVRPILGKE